LFVQAPIAIEIRSSYTQHTKITTVLQYSLLYSPSEARPTTTSYDLAPGANKEKLVVLSFCNTIDIIFVELHDCLLAHLEQTTLAASGEKNLTNLARM